MTNTTRVRRFRGDQGITLVADEAGDPQGPPVLFLHGWGQTRHAWGATVEDVAGAGWHAISLDLRGHGDSGWPADVDYGIESFARDLLAVVEQLPETPALVGASLGGMTSLVATTLRPTPVASRLVLVDITPSVRPEGVWRVLQFMAEGAAGFDTVEEASAAVANYLPHRERPSDLGGLRKNLRQGDDGRYRWHWDPRFLDLENFAPPDEATMRRHTQDTRRQLLDAARRLEIPVLLVHGQLSDIVDVSGVDELLEVVPHAEYVNVRDAGHMVAGDSNDRFTDAITAFLARDPRTGPDR